MSIAKKEMFDSTKPVDTKDMARAGEEAENISKQIQRRYGTPGGDVIKSSPFQRGVSLDKARLADVERQQEFTPKAYETVSGIEDRQTKTQDELAKFWDEYLLRSDELAMKQSQAEREASLYSRMKAAETEDKIKKIEFTAFQNDAQRQDSLEKAYLDGHANTQMLKAAINGQVKMADIEKYWELQINEIRQWLLDVRAWSEAEMETFKYNMEVSGSNWAAIISGLTTLTKTGMENYDTIEKMIKNFKGEGAEA